jgi:hypothetical protein
MMKFSRAINRVKWLNGEKSNVSKTISVLVLRVLPEKTSSFNIWCSNIYYKNGYQTWKTMKKIRKTLGKYEHKDK